VHADRVILALARRANPESRIVGVLSDGTSYFAPIGQVVVDGARVRCHLCGSTFRSVAAHLSRHGWTKAQYCEAFGLERGQSLEGDDTRKLRAAALSGRLLFEPAMREGSARGRDRARSGELTKDAAAAARGRPFPAQRRQRSRTALSPVARMQLGQANRERADRRIAELADKVAREHGYADIWQLVYDRINAGQSLASISRSCGLDKDWLSRHLPRLDPVLAARAIRSDDVLDAQWLPAIRTLGFADVASYLRQRHLVEHMTVNSIAREVGLSFHTIRSGLSRHGVTFRPHIAKRDAAEGRVREVAAALGVSSISEFIVRSKAQGLTWQQMAALSGQPETWLRRHAASRS